MRIVLRITGNGHDWHLKFCCSQAQVKVCTTLNIYYKIILDHSITERNKQTNKKQDVLDTPMYPNSDIHIF